jgi:hypothetical protein
VLARLVVVAGVLAAAGALGIACGKRGLAGDGGDAGPRDAVGDAAECDNHHFCTQMGCMGPTGDLQVQFEIRVAAPMDGLPGSAVTGCRNGVCVTGTLLSREQSPYHCDCVQFPAEEVVLRASVHDNGDAGPPVLRAGWGSNFGLVPQLPDPNDGDRFSVEMATPGGAVVAAAAGQATYEVDQPNGSCCEPTCVYASLTLVDAGVGDQ